jgi:signal transduction histidine kinase
MDPSLSALVVHDLKNRLAVHEQRLSEFVAAHPELSAELQPLRVDTVALHRRLVAFLTLYRDDAHGLSANEREEEPAAALMLAARSARALVPTRHIDVEIDAARAPFEWFFDAYLVGLALDAALDNAVRYARTRIRLSAWCEDNWLVLAVEDDGPGLGADDSDELENQTLDTALHDRVAAEHRGRVAGRPSQTGLGTELCRSVARLHTCDGRIGEVRLVDRAAAGETGGGTRFELRLP